VLAEIVELIGYIVGIAICLALILTGEA